MKLMKHTLTAVIIGVISAPSYSLISSNSAMAVENCEQTTLRQKAIRNWKKLYKARPYNTQGLMWQVHQSLTCYPVAGINTVRVYQINLNGSKGGLLYEFHDPKVGFRTNLRTHPFSNLSKTKLADLHKITRRCGEYYDLQKGDKLRLPYMTGMKWRLRMTCEVTNKTFKLPYALRPALTM